jgi:cytosine/adenosine deaminase-related metal-dependent hydrolase
MTDLKATCIIEAGTILVGVDASGDMTLEMKLVWALHRETGLFNARPDAAAVLQMATEHGARTVGFDGFTGWLEPGYQADVVLLDRATLERPFVNPRTPMAETILHRGGRGAIDQVVVGGQLVVDKGRVISIDRDAVLSELNDHLRQPESPEELAAWEVLGGLMPVLEQHQRDQALGAGYRSYRFNAMSFSS